MYYRLVLNEKPIRESFKIYDGTIVKKHETKEFYPYYIGSTYVESWDGRIFRVKNEILDYVYTPDAEIEWVTQRLENV